MSTGNYLSLAAIIISITGIIVTIWNNSRNRFNSAAEKLRTAFHGELIALDSALAIGPDNVSEFLAAAFDKHQAAIREFLPVLINSSRFVAGGLEEAWNEYYKFENQYSLMIQYAGIPNCGEEEAKRRKLLAKRRIERILYYAQNK